MAELYELNGGQAGTYIPCSSKTSNIKSLGQKCGMFGLFFISFRNAVYHVDAINTCLAHKQISISGMYVSGTLFPLCCVWFCWVATNFTHCFAWINTDPRMDKQLHAQ